MKTLVDKHMQNGSYQANWDGVDDTGRSVSSGVYFYRLKTTGHTACKKMLLLK